VERNLKANERTRGSLKFITGLFISRSRTNKNSTFWKINRSSEIQSTWSKSWCL